MAGDNPSSNPFVRFKNNVDSHFKRGVETLTGPLNPDPTSQLSRNEKLASHPQHGTSGSNEDRASAEDVYNWAASSPYSPVNLQHLPQPKPRDAPQEWQDSFTFRDAFEDLLTERSGQPPWTIRGLAFSNMYWTYHYRHGLPVEDWVVSLGQRGLWGAYFPLSSWDKRVLSVPIPDSIPREKMFDMRYGISDASRIPGRWRQDLSGKYSWPTTERHNSWPWSSWMDTSSSEDREKTEKAVEHTASRSGDADIEEDLYRGTKTLTDIMERMKSMQRSIFDSFDRSFDRNSARKDGTGDDSTAEDDLHSIIKSATDMVKSVFSPYWGDFNNDNNNGDENINPANNAESDNTSTVATTAAATTNYPVHDRAEKPVVDIIPTADGGKIVYSVQRSTRGGREQVTTTRERFDADGNLLSRSRETASSSTRVWSTKAPGVDASASWSWKKTATAQNTIDDEDKDDDGYGDDIYDDEDREKRRSSGRGADGKRSGWFWTK
ncbi:hypothetical protein F5X99DRAFT_372934 [Biscogniauxia marginata]|nr:hypothetical protein F5X99DRAFT_372934 [Biscogniauxia marginata]